MALAATSLFSERVVETLHGEALLLADETRAYFDGLGHAERAALEPKARAQFAGEALKATTRLSEVTTWLTLQRIAGTSVKDRSHPARQFGASMPSDNKVLGALPPAARQLILTGIELHERIGRLAAGVATPITTSPGRFLAHRLEREF